MARFTGLAVAACSICAAACADDARVERGPVETTARLVTLPPVDHLDGLAREPMIVEAPGGALFVSGYGTEEPRLWRSVDGGGTWVSMDVGSEADGAVGNSDVDLAVGPAGTLYLTVMSFDRQAFEGTGIAVAANPEAGASRAWTWLSRDRFDDRPWIDVAPDGTAHVIWNDGAGVSHAVSRDRGVTWTERARIHPRGGSSHFAIGPAGTLAVRITPFSASSNKRDPGTDHLAVSTDGGASWKLHDPPGSPTWTFTFDPTVGVPRWVEPLAWDDTGALYALWSEGTTLWLGRSTDEGEGWTSWPVVTGDAVLYFPYLAARGGGELAATWYSGAGASLRANLALITLDRSAGGMPRVARADPIAVSAFRPAEDEGPVGPDTAGEYVPVIFLSDGRLAAVTTVQDPLGDRWGFTFRPYEIVGSS